MSSWAYLYCILPVRCKLLEDRYKVHSFSITAAFNEPEASVDFSRPVPSSIKCRNFISKSPPDLNILGFHDVPEGIRSARSKHLESHNSTTSSPAPAPGEPLSHVHLK